MHGCEALTPLCPNQVPDLFKTVGVWNWAEITSGLIDTTLCCLPWTWEPHTHVSLQFESFQKALINGFLSSLIPLILLLILWRVSMHCCLTSWLAKPWNRLQIHYWFLSGWKPSISSGICSLKCLRWHSPVLTMNGPHFVHRNCSGNICDMYVYIWGYGVCVWCIYVCVIYVHVWAVVCVWCMVCVYNFVNVPVLCVCVCCLFFRFMNFIGQREVHRSLE